MEQAHVGTAPASLVLFSSPVTISKQKVGKMKVSTCNILLGSAIIAVSTVDAKKRSLYAEKRCEFLLVISCLVLVLSDKSSYAFLVEL